MSQENVELVRKATNAGNAGGLAATLPFYSEDAVWYNVSGRRPTAPRRSVATTVPAQLAAGWSDSFDDFKIISQQLHDLGETIVALGEMHGVIKNSNDTVRQPMGSVVTDFRGGRIGETRFYLSWEADPRSRGAVGARRSRRLLNVTGTRAI